ncbi:MAG: DUF4402 domain-containing protein [Ignavibacteriaceae bacterium]|nr:DUF4402 domain-containing protein [Ignavibacteriaceae bacterium]
MKILIVAVLIYIFSVVAIGQSASTTASGTVNIIQPLSITSLGGSLDFGEIIITGAATTYQILPAQGQYFQILGHPGRSVSIIFNLVNLSNAIWVGLNGGTIGTLVFTPQVVNNLNEPIISGNFYPLTINGTMGELDIRVGGSITVQPNQPHGDYIGNFIVTVSY